MLCIRGSWSRARPRPRAIWKQKVNNSCSNKTNTAISSRRASTAAGSARNGRPFRLAVIGSGPAGFYTAYRAMSKMQNAHVDMYEALPVPFGLVRFGVAPDHPEVKVWHDTRVCLSTPTWICILTGAELPGKV